MLDLKDLYYQGHDAGIKQVFDAFEYEIEENWTGDFRANAQYLVDKVKMLFTEELARAGE